MNKNEKLDMHTGIACAIIFSVVAIIMAICALARNNERTLGFDYLGVIVGVLALLVTFLVGWQIYTTIGITHKMANAEKRIEIGESRIKNMLQNIEKVKSEINRSSDLSKEMGVGINRLAIATTLFYSCIVDKNTPIDSNLRRCIDCYKLSAGALEKFMSISKEDERIMSVEVCLQLLEKTGKIIFDTKHLNAAKKNFDEKCHKLCSDCYIKIISNRAKLTEIQLDIIETCHIKRNALLNNVEPNPAGK